MYLLPTPNFTRVQDDDNDRRTTTTHANNNNNNKQPWSINDFIITNERMKKKSQFNFLSAIKYTIHLYTK